MATRHTVDRFFVKCWLAFFATVMAIVGGCGSTAAAVPVTTAPTTTTRQREVDLAALVLSPHDVGSGYNQNAGATHAEPFRDAAFGDSPRIVALLHRVWIGGSEAGYTSAQPDHPGVWCAADVFRSTKLGLIAKAWMADGLDQFGGVSAPAPQGAPGKPLWFYHGHLTLSGVRVAVVGYGWQHGHSIGHLTIASQTSKGLDAVAMRMAQLEDAHLRILH